MDELDDFDHCLIRLGAMDSEKEFGPFRNYLMEKEFNLDPDKVELKDFLNELLDKIPNYFWEMQKI